MTPVTLNPGPRCGVVTAPPSKSHGHRLLIADFLAGDTSRLAADENDPADIAATKRCLAALATDAMEPILECGESASTMRFLAPVAAALGKHPIFRKSGRLAKRPAFEYASISSGLHELQGDVSSQFATGLLFALPLLHGDSRIRFTSPLESRGYVDMTLAVLRGAGIKIEELPDGFAIQGGQCYHSQRDVAVEGDWSGAAFWFAMNAIGSRVEVRGLNPDSAQPDRMAADMLRDLPNEIDVSQMPDAFPALAVASAARERETVFCGIQRLRVKECDRVAAMADILSRFGRRVEVASESFRVRGNARPFDVGDFATWNDHRIAMAIAVGATRAVAPVTIDNAGCAAKSYPGFFAEFAALRGNLTR